MNTVRVTEKAASIDLLSPTLSTTERPVALPGQCVIEVHSAGVNPSDVKAALGLSLIHI